MADDFDIDQFSDYVASDASSDDDSPEASDPGIQLSSPEQSSEENEDPNKFTSRDFEGTPLAVGFRCCCSY